MLKNFTKYLYLASILLMQSDVFSSCTANTINTTPIQTLSSFNNNFAYISDSLAVSADQNTLTLYSISSTGTWNAVNSVNLPAHSITQQFISVHNNFIAVTFTNSVGFGGIYTYTVNNNTLTLAGTIAPGGDFFQASDIQYSPDGATLAVVYPQGSITFSGGVVTYLVSGTNTLSVSQSPVPLPAGARFPQAISYSGNLAAIAYSSFSGHVETYIKLYNYNSGILNLSALPAVIDTTGVATSLAFSPDGAYLVAAYSNNAVVYNVTPAGLTTNASLAYPFSSLVPAYIAFASNTIFAIAGADSSGNQFINIYQLSNGVWSLLQTSTVTSPSQVYDNFIAYQPNTTTLAVSSGPSGNISLYSVCQSPIPPTPTTLSASLALTNSETNSIQSSTTNQIVIVANPPAGSVAPYTYHWTSNLPNFVDPGTQSITVNPTVTAQYQVTITDALRNKYQSDPFTVKHSLNLVAANISPLSYLIFAKEFCPKTTVTRATTPQGFGSAGALQNTTVVSTSPISTALQGTQLTTLSNSTTTTVVTLTAYNLSSPISVRTGSTITLTLAASSAADFYVLVDSLGHTYTQTSPTFTFTFNGFTTTYFGYFVDKLGRKSPNSNSITITATQGGFCVAGALQNTAAC